ncbi:MAG: hypothetical protein GY930_03195 [bacterium]|nr:hypothetical protein [bacterium]
MLHRLLLSCFCCLILPMSAIAQGKEVRYREIGVTMAAPKGYDAMPIPRTKNVLKLVYVRRDEQSGTTLTLSLYRTAVKPGVSGVDDSFLANVLKAKATGKTKKFKSLGEYKRLRYPFERNGRRGYLFSYVGGDYAYFLVGESPSALFDSNSSAWNRTADELRIHPPARDDRKRAELELKYGRSRHSDKERRIQANLSLVEGWHAFDSEEYIYLLHGDDTQAWKEFDGQLSGVRRYLTEHVLSHRNQEPEDVGVVRLCQSRQEYLDYGGQGWTAGYFSPSEDELVLYDPGDVGAMLGVLRHESFHQYIYAALGGISPHIWFDEGYAELMASARVEGQRLTGFNPMPHHLQILSQMLGEDGKGLEPLDVFLHLSQKDFYAAPNEYYAQAWIWLEFLMNSHYGQRSSRGEDFIKSYVRHIREEWKKRVEASSSGGALHTGTLVEVREFALFKALKHFDLKAAEPAFLRFVKERIAVETK